MDLDDILRQPEGKQLEFKRDLSSPEKVLRTLIAFANTSGGTLVLGVEDGSHEVRGVEAPLDLEERLANLVSDSIVPRLLPEFEILRHRDLQVVAVTVHPSASRPHHLASKGPEASSYVRVGSTNRLADTALIEEMRRFVRGSSFDEQAMPGIGVETIDLDAVVAAFTGIRKIGRKDLETLRLVTTHQGKSTPTVGGMLLFGKERLSHFPDAWIQAARFDGNDRSRFLDRVDLRDSPTQAIARAVDFVAKHSLHGASIGALRRRDHWSIPPTAIREAMVNAVVHADYSQQGAPIRLAIHDDRVEIENPGLLPFGLTLADLPLGVSKLRNRVIGRVFHELGLVEQWGSGVQRMLTACSDAGLPPPTWEEVGLRMRVTIPTRSTGAAKVDEVDRAILGLLEHPGGRGTVDIATAIGISTRATRTRLAKLVERGLVRELGSHARDPQRRYLRVMP